ncbi:hypothetical protein MNAN1_002721 [Malassezia nana]|uniref:Uncharacterized protein n=1 Tax=Malassezia nana TaxID=180528 RepID=A0AAF0EMS5_9BASI|nr:hypothetical protein MNAN1_002721 [Malassezia nana]
MGLHEVHQAWLERLTLVLAPECHAPRRITLASDMHPLPPSIEAYCTYPFAAEKLAQTLTNRLSADQLRAQEEEHAAFLQQWHERKEKERQSTLRTMTPSSAHENQSIASTTPASVLAQPPTEPCPKAD